MILFLDIEHPKALEDPVYRAERVITMEARRQLFAELSGQPCQTRHYSEFRKDEVHAPEVTALVTSGNRAMWDDYDLPYDFSQFEQAIAETRKPVLGICGGHQLIGMLMGGESAPVRELAPGEADEHREYAPGYLKEIGYYDIGFDSAEPLFAGFNERITVKQSHFWHLTRLPESLRPIAWNENCPVQAMRHEERPLYGVQFHPELHDRDHPDGRRLLQSFFALSKPL